MSNTPHFKPGDRIADRYEIVAPLGRGGIAQVYRGIQLGMNRPVAIKIMAPNLDGKKASEHEEALETFARRFEQEAQVLSTLHDPATVTVHDFGFIGADRLPYMILELVQGISLAELKEEELPMSQHRATKILRQVLESLREAHFLGILHRDIKPANIMIFERLGERDHVKVLDFGLAKIYQSDALTALEQTQEGMLVGTPRYVAPELLHDPKAASPRSDLYSVGLVAYELLTGQRAIEREEVIDIIAAQLSHEPFVVPEQIELLPQLRALLTRLIAKRPEDRPATAQDALNALTQEIIPALAWLESAAEEEQNGGAPELALSDAAPTIVPKHLELAATSPVKAPTPRVLLASRLSLSSAPSQRAVSVADLDQFPPIDDDAEPSMTIDLSEELIVSAVGQERALTPGGSARPVSVSIPDSQARGLSPSGPKRTTARRSAPRRPRRRSRSMSARRGALAWTRGTAWPRRSTRCR